MTSRLREKTFDGLAQIAQNVGGEGDVVPRYPAEFGIEVGARLPNRR